MSRLSPALLALVILLVAVCSSNAWDNQPSAKPKVLPVAPFPHSPRNQDLPENWVPLRLPPDIDKEFTKVPGSAIPKDEQEYRFVDTYRCRQGATRSKLQKDYGGNEASDRAVAAGLAWLAGQQKPDGSWIFDGTATNEVTPKNEVTAATGMALLAFLGYGQTHTSENKYKETVVRGLNYLLTNLTMDGLGIGKFDKSNSMYGQAIGTTALCEAYGMTRDKQLLKPAQAAINYIQRAQGANGSWGYAAGTVGDVSIVFWQVQALQAARLSRAVVVQIGRSIKPLPSST
jgi:hypothetical protein